MDATTRALLRKYRQDPSPENAVALANAMVRSTPILPVLQRPYTLDEILQFKGPVRGFVHLDFTSLWRNSHSGARIEFEEFLDTLSNALVGDEILVDITYDIRDVNEDGSLIVEVQGSVGYMDEDEDYNQPRVRQDDEDDDDDGLGY